MGYSTKNNKKKSTITFKDTNHSFYNTILNGLRSIANLNKFVLIFVMNDKITPAFILPPPFMERGFNKRTKQRLMISCNPTAFQFFPNFLYQDYTLKIEEKRGWEGIFKRETRERGGEEVGF